MKKAKLIELVYQFHLKCSMSPLVVSQMITINHIIYVIEYISSHYEIKQLDCWLLNPDSL